MPGWSDSEPVDAAVAISGRHVNDDSTRPIGHARNEAAVVEYARRLLRRVESILSTGRVPLVIGGDCSLLIAAGVALAPLNTIGLAHTGCREDDAYREEASSILGLVVSAESAIDIGMAGLAQEQKRQRVRPIGYISTPIHSTRSLCPPWTALPSADSGPPNSESSSSDLPRERSAHR